MSGLSRPKLLIAGGSYADVPMIKAARNMGFRVITSGNRPTDLGHAYADEVALEDFSDKEAMFALARRLGVDAICPSCNDFSALTSAWVAERLGLPGHDPFEVAETLHEKDRFRELCRMHQIPSPRAAGFCSVAEALSGLDSFSLPVLVKPVDLTGGKGIARVDHRAGAAAAIRAAFERSRAKRVVIEEFVEGSRHGFTGLLVGGKLSFCFADNEHYYVNPFLVWAASSPTTLPKRALEEMIRNLEKIAALLRLRDGIIHSQLILRGLEPVIIEICRRPPGDLYPRFVEIASGVPYPELIVAGFAGREILVPRKSETERYVSRHCLMTDRPGRLEQVRVKPPDGARIIEEFTWWRAGEMVMDPTTHKFGIVFVEYSDRERMLAVSERFSDHVEVVFESPQIP